jgi:hypothetical protein
LFVDFAIILPATLSPLTTPAHRQPTNPPLNQTSFNHYIHSANPIPKTNPATKAQPVTMNTSITTPNHHHGLSHYITIAAPLLTTNSQFTNTPKPQTHSHHPQTIIKITHLPLTNKPANYPRPHQPTNLKS